MRRLMVSPEQAGKSVVWKAAIPTRLIRVMVLAARFAHPRVT